MLWRDSIYLVSQQTTKDSDGYLSATETKRELLADVNSTSRAEFYQAVQAGIRLALSVTIRYLDYQNEKILEYDGRRYKIERTYSKDRELLELNCSEIIEEAV